MTGSLLRRHALCMLGTLTVALSACGSGNDEPAPHLASEGTLAATQPLGADDPSTSTQSLRREMRRGPAPGSMGPPRLSTRNRPYNGTRAPAGAKPARAAANPARGATAATTDSSEPDGTGVRAPRSAAGVAGSTSGSGGGSSGGSAGAGGGGAGGGSSSAARSTASEPPGNPSPGEIAEATGVSAPSETPAADPMPSPAPSPAVLASVDQTVRSTVAPQGSAVVPPPFAPLRLSRISGGYAVRAWGRVYRFSGPLPRSIVSQERELLAAPITILVDGTPLSWGPVRMAESRADRIVLEADSMRGPLVFHATVQIEYDGMIQIDLSISGDGELSSLAYELPLRSDHAALFNHHLVYDFSSQNIVKGSTLEAAGTTPRGTHRYDFVPSFWLGDRDVGIEWWSESNAEWHGPAATRPYELQRGPSQTVLRVEPISAPRVLAGDEVWKDRIALFPMPMRPQARNWRSVRFTSQGASTPSFDRTIGTRLTWVAFGTAFSARWHGLPESRRDDRQEKLRRRLSLRSVAYIPYGKLTVAPSMHPKTMAMFDEWSAAASWFRTAPGDELSVLRENGQDFDPARPVSYGVCMGRKDYLDWLLAENVKAFEGEDLDGLYFDFGAISRMCTKNPALVGRPGREVWEYGNVRDFYKRLYAAMKSRNPDALLVSHSAGQPRALTAFMDFHWVGEHYNGIFSGGANMSAIQANPARYKPDYLALPDGFLDATALPHVGGAWVVLPQIKFARDPAVMRPAHRALHGWALASDVPIILGNTHNDTGVGILRALDRFGSLADTTFEPWWSRARKLTTDPPFRASAYHAGGRALIVVLNPSATEATRSVGIDLTALQIGGGATWRDLEKDDPPAPLANGRLSVRVGARDFRIFAVE